MSDAVEVEVDSSNSSNHWKISDSHCSKPNAPVDNCYFFGYNVSSMLLNVENSTNNNGMTDLTAKGNINESSTPVNKLKNSHLKIDFTDVIDVEENLFTNTSNVKFNPSMLLQVELNTADASLNSRNNSVVSNFNSSAPSEAAKAKYKDPPTLPYVLPLMDSKPPHLTKCWKCSICDKEFTDENNLKIHANIHGQRTKSRRCDYCELTFPSKGKWYAHFKTHFNDPSFDCAFCNCSFVTEKYLGEHMKFHTVKHTSISNNGNFSIDYSEERIFPCTFCEKEFSDRSGILFHLRIHTSDIIFRCMYCGKMFLNKSELNLHVRIHTGDKAHVCDLCNKSFLTTSNLKQHIRTHTGDKPFCCTNCQKAFSNKSNLMQHIKVHTGEKPYRCKFCEKSFTTTSNLTQHLRTHTGVKPYVCEDCGKAFINKSNLSQHRKVHSSVHLKNGTKGKK